MTTYPGLVFCPQDKRLVAVVTAAAERVPIDRSALDAAIAAAGYGDCLLCDEALATLVDRYNAGGEATLTLGEMRDAACTVDVSPDAMQAWVSVTPARGGRPLVADDIYQALGAAAVTFGVDQAAVTAACAAGEAGRFLVATGVAAVNGEDARFTLLVDDARERTPRIGENGLIDFRELGEIPTVAADAPLMRREPPTYGSEGHSVRGEVIEPRRGRDEQFSSRLVGAYIDQEDRNLLRAVFAGQPVHGGNGVNVEQVLHLRSVNMATGNIVFDGSVRIDGEVLPGMKVTATGDIVVGDVVDGAMLTAEGDIRIAGGVIAKARVQAGGAVAARFVENATIVAGTTITIEDSALQSELQANNQIVVGAKSTRRGRLAGGSARATMLIRAPLLGSPTTGLTRLQLGVNPVLEQQYEELLHRIEKLRADENALEKVVKHLTGKNDKADMLARAKASWQQALQKWGELMAEREELEHRLALIAGARVVVEVGVDGAADLAFGKKVGHLRRGYESGFFLVADDKVSFTDAAGKVVVAD